VESEMKLIHATNATPRSVLFAAVIATNIEQAISLERQITNLPSVASVDSITSFMAENQTGKLAIVGEIKDQIASLKFQDPDRSPVNIVELSTTLYSFYGYVGAAHDEVKKEDPKLAEQFETLQEAVGELRKEMTAGNAIRVQTNSLRLSEFQQALLNDVH